MLEGERIGALIWRMPDSIAEMTTWIPMTWKAGIPRPLE
jgi:hypothetical protein